MSNIAITTLLLAACAAPPPPPLTPTPSPTPQGSVAPPSVAAVAEPLVASTAVSAEVTPVARPKFNAADAVPSAPARPARAETRTRHAIFRSAAFDELPGWQRDELQDGWPAFRNSCAVLQRRETWRDVCAQARNVASSSTAMRAFFESRFALLRIVNVDASNDGDITGYFEPLLDGRREPDADFYVPVMGVPRDLYGLDWIDVPAARRRGVVFVKPTASTLAVLEGAEPGSYALDMRQFELDTRDRRLRLRLTRVGASLRAEPYYSRAELDAVGLPRGIDAPVLAWVNDAVALYAMQVQGSGRIRFSDGTILRLEYAEQNGHPFRPLRVVAKAEGAIRTRGVSALASAADEFVLEDVEADSTASADETVRTRGVAAQRSDAAPGAPKSPTAADAVVEELLGPARSRERPAAPANRPKSPTASATGPGVAAPPPARRGPNRAAAAMLASDPSYVFFKQAAGQTLQDGPRGALGVPLTPGRSVAVDPRVTPLGYPVFLSAPAREGSVIEMQRLVFAQDTGGAIRGAVRADFFWGFGADAGQLARGTRRKGQMWLMLPKAEAEHLRAGTVVTRGLAAGRAEAAGCLLADDEFCLEPN